MKVTRLLLSGYYRGGYFAEIPLDSGNEKPKTVKMPRALLSLKSAGNMSVSKIEFIESLSIDPERVFYLKQVHSKEVYAAEDIAGAERGSVIGDGLVCRNRDDGIILAVTVADCLPIFILDKSGGAYGLVHSGWKGTGIVLNAIDILVERYGSKPDDLRVVIGPGIGPCCYNVSKERYDLFISSYGKGSGVEADGNFYLDLRATNINLLHGKGVDDIIVIDECTSCNAKLWSFRRDGKNGFGTMLAMIGDIESL